MTDSVLERIRAALGGPGAERDLSGRPRAAPDDGEGVAAVCRLAHAEGWRVRIEGRGTWCPADAPADFAVTTAGLDRIVHVSRDDLVATVEAGVTVSTLERALAAHGVWLPIDPPGRPDRTVGAIFATGTSGPLRHGLGQPRDYVLGCTVVTGDGRIVKSGGSVVKNVAGYDLMKLQVGGFGAFGIVTELHLRLRALPADDRTALLRGERDELTVAARALVSGGLDTAALELLSPAVAADADWVLAVRLMGTAAGVTEEADRLDVLTKRVWTSLNPEQAGHFWPSIARSHLAGPGSVRLGVLPEGIDGLLDLLEERLDLGLVTASPGFGGVRWTGNATPDRLIDLRRAAASREIPMTVERGPWDLRAAVGHFGAYREGAGIMVDRLREVFDPHKTFVIPLDTHGDD